MATLDLPCASLPEADLTWWAVAAVRLSPITDSISWLPSGTNLVVITSEFLLSSAHNPKNTFFWGNLPCHASLKTSTVWKVTLRTFLLTWAWDEMQCGHLTVATSSNSPHPHPLGHRSTMTCAVWCSSAGQQSGRKNVGWRRCNFCRFTHSSTTARRPRYDCAQETNNHSVIFYFS